jgi:hypothetical protein
MKGGAHVRRLIGWGVGLSGIALLVLGVLHFGDLQSFGLLLRHAQPW